MALEFHLGVMKIFSTRQLWWLHNNVNILSTDELLALKWLILH